MKFRMLIVFAALTSLVSAGCVSGPGARTGTAFGGLSGALVGAAAGANKGKSLEGAAIGALAGSALGGAIGNAADRDNDRWMANQVAYEQDIRARSVSMDQVIQMTQSGLGDQVITNQIRTQGVAAPLTTNDLVMLKQSGVSDNVISAWQQQSRVQPATVPPRQVIVREHWVEPAFGPDCYYYGPHGNGPRHHGTRAGLHFRF